jgi:uncharacterized protein
MKARRVVIDTNVLISAALSSPGTPAQLLRHVLEHERLVFSEQTFAELNTRLYRPKFDRYITLEQRQRLLHDLSACADWVTVSSGPRRSRDPDDDVFIETALAAQAYVLASGDSDLLDVPLVERPLILNPTQALAQLLAPAPR